MLQANDPGWHRLRPNHTLRLALAQKEVVEFPLIVVALPDELPGFNILGSSHEPKQPPAAGAAASAARDTTPGSNDTKRSPSQLPATAARVGSSDTTKQPPTAAAAAAAAIDNILGGSTRHKAANCSRSSSKGHHSRQWQ